MTRWMWAAVCAASAVSGSGCGETMESPPPPPATTIAEGAEVSYELVYQAPSYTGFGVVDRPWIPIDLSGSESGQLWVVQRMPRDPAFDDETECTSRSQAGEANYCGGLQGSTATITDPAALEPATEGNGRLRLVVDFNAWHFMRRPSAIAMGAPRIELPITDEGARDPATGAPLGGDTLVYTDTFGTCHEHWTGNFTDQGAFIGPSLWTGDPAIYNGVNGTDTWSNGAHLDMVHATQYCMGMAHERDNVYWVFNGMIGAIERYDFVRPHVPGHSYHEDGIVTRYDLAANPLARLDDVPSNMVVEGTDLYIADTGNGRVVRFDTTQPTTLFSTFLTFEAIEAELHDGGVLVDLVTRETLALEWGARVEPSGLAFLDEHVVIANHGSGHITLVAQDGSVVRTLDTGLGAGIGGLTVLDGQIYFTHMGTRAVYRVDVVEPTEEI